MEGFNMGKESIHSAYVHFVGETLFFYLRKESSLLIFVGSRYSLNVFLVFRLTGVNSIIGL